MYLRKFKLILASLLLFVSLIGNGPSSTNDPPSSESSLTIPEYLQDITVIVDTPVSTGTGIVFTRKDSTGTNDVTFIWTAGHVYYDQFPMLKRIPTLKVFSSETLTNRLFNLNKINIIREIIRNGERIGTASTIADIVKCSPPDSGDDLALYMVRGNFWTTNTAVFSSDVTPLTVGTKVCSVSCPSGEWGIYSEGVISKLGIMVFGYVFDQTSCTTVYEGSSGGGVFTMDGKCVGMTTRMQAPAINVMIPIRRIMRWAKEENVEWAVDPNIPIPSKEEMKKIPREDTVHHKLTLRSDLFVSPPPEFSEPKK